LHLDLVHHVFQTLLVGRTQLCRGAHLDNCICAVASLAWM
jgi:hypothetical protein